MMRSYCGDAAHGKTVSPRGEQRRGSPSAASVEPVSSPAPPAGLPPNRAAADVAKVTLTRLVPGAPVPADLGLPGRRVPGPLTAAIFAFAISEERRVGNGGISTVTLRRSPC